MDKFQTALVLAADVIYARADEDKTVEAMDKVLEHLAENFPAPDFESNKAEVKFILGHTGKTLPSCWVLPPVCSEQVWPILLVAFLIRELRNEIRIGYLTKLGPFCDAYSKLLLA